MAQSNSMCWRRFPGPADQFVQSLTHWIKSITGTRGVFCTVRVERFCSCFGFRTAWRKCLYGKSTEKATFLYGHRKRRSLCGGTYCALRPSRASLETATCWRKVMHSRVAYELPIRIFSDARDSNVASSFNVGHVEPDRQVVQSGALHL